MLSPGNQDGQDEDPSVLIAADGALYVAWYSDRNGVHADGSPDREVFIMRSYDGLTWEEPVQVTRSQDWAFYPSLAQDDAGTFHMVWWQMHLLPDGCVPGATCTGTSNTLLYKSSPDGVTWDLDTRTTIAAGPGDWLPSLLVERATQRLEVYFASPVRTGSGAVSLSENQLRIYRVTRDGMAWSAPQRLTGLSAGTSHDTYPHVLQRDDGTYLMTFTRYDGSGPSGVLDVLGQASTQTLVATSSDGLAWNLPAALSGAAKLDVFPYAFADGTDTRVVWLSADPGAPAGETVSLPIGGTYPTDLVSYPEINGYTTRMLMTPTSGIGWAVWVSGPTDRQKLWTRFFDATP